MEFLGIGPSELAFIIIIALIILGPKDMQKAGKTIGKWMRDVITSDGWKVFQQTSREVRNLPTRLIREANEELINAVNINPASDPAGTSSGLNKNDLPPRAALPPAPNSVSIDPSIQPPMSQTADATDAPMPTPESSSDQNA